MIMIPTMIMMMTMILFMILVVIITGRFSLSLSVQRKERGETLGLRWNHTILQNNVDDESRRVRH